MLEIAESNDRVIAMSADLGNSSGLDRFRKTLPDRFVNVGIAEQNMIGIASGLAMAGFIPFVSSFAPFITMRAAEQVRMDMGYMGLNVKAVGIGSGLSMGFLGNSHFGLEDISVIKAIHGISIYSPADCGELVKTLLHAANTQEPCYVRLTGEPNQQAVYQSDYHFEVGKIIELRRGRQIAILATGSLVAHALAAARLLETDSLDISVFNVHTIRPLDLAGLSKVFENYSVVFTLEEHSVDGGLGSSVAEILASSQYKPVFRRLGISGGFGPTGKYSFLLRHHELDAVGIRGAVLQVVNSW